MSKRKRKYDTNVRKVKKKSDGKRFALDTLLGKMLCILLAVILMAGAFLTPKLLSSLYDARTLMQIVYTDMDLKTYEVAYTDFQKKMEAVAREKTAGNKLLTLTTEEAESKLSDEELIKLVNEEMTDVEKGMDFLFMEGWWSALTTDNLVSRRKNTVYARKQGDAQEMAPFSTWTLVFQVTDKQKEVKVSDGKGGYLIENQFTTDRLIVCMDADFYKIYAVAIVGDMERIELVYGLDMSEWIWNYGELKKTKNMTPALSGYLKELQTIRMAFAERSLQGWTNYWGVILKDRAYSEEMMYDATSYMGGCLVFGDETKEAQSDGASDQAAQTDETDLAAQEISVEDTDASLRLTGGAKLYLVNGESVYIYMPEERTADETYLEAGVEAEWEEKDVIIKFGCREFFEMLQF